MRFLKKIPTEHINVISLMLLWHSNCDRASVLVGTLTMSVSLLFSLNLEQLKMVEALSHLEWLRRPRRCLLLIDMQNILILSYKTGLMK